MKKLLLLFILTQTQAIENMDRDIDYKTIESYKKIPITMPAKYLKVLSIVYEKFSSNKNREIENYAVQISENKSIYVVEFSIPWNKPVLGGGFGFYHIDKHTMKIIKVTFYK